MGLLSDPKSREKIVNIISKHNNFLCVVCYIVGLGWFLALAYKPLNADTYFSENALLPGLVENNFKETKDAEDFLYKLKDELRARKASLPKDDPEIFRIPSKWLEQEFRSLGLDSYVQNFSFHYPAVLLKEQEFMGKNMYAILRAPRAASTEALVMSIPFRPPEGLESDRTYPGIALMLALAKSFRRHSYWAKDIIFLITEYEQIGMQAWLGSYHDHSSEYIKADELKGRGGSIQAAINLELAHEEISRFNIKLEGLNGQLPNLDLVNTVARLCKLQQMPPAIQRKSNAPRPEELEGFQHALLVMLQMMWNQAGGIQTGNHGLFHRYNIEAVTLQSMKLKGSRRSFSFFEMGRILEGVFRSMNNLLERFHQSFFFYLLPATDRYVSIGLYMPPFGIMAIPIIIKALSLWIAHCFRDISEDKGEDKDGQEDVNKEDVHEEVSGKEEKVKSSNEKGNGDQITETKALEDEPGYLSVMPVFIMVMMFGLIGYKGAPNVMITAIPFHMTPGDALSFGIIALSIAGMFFPTMLARKSRAKNINEGANPYLLKTFALLYLGTLLGSISVMNISLAFFLALEWVPVMTLIWPSERRIIYYPQYVLLIAVSPFSLVLQGTFIQNFLTAYKNDSMAAILLKTWTGVQKSLVTGFVDCFMIGNWMFSIVTLAIFPAWLLFWSLLWAVPMKNPGRKEKTST